MKIDIKYTQFQMTEDIDEYARKCIGSVARLLKSFEVLKEIIVFVEIARSTKHHRHGDVFYAEATFDLDGKTVRAEATEPDIRLAIDSVKEKIKKEVRRYKDKLITTQRRRHNA